MTQPSNKPAPTWADPNYLISLLDDHSPADNTNATTDNGEAGEAPPYPYYEMLGDDPVARSIAGLMASLEKINDTEGVFKTLRQMLLRSDLKPRTADSLMKRFQEIEATRLTESSVKLNTLKEVPVTPYSLDRQTVSDRQMPIVQYAQNQDGDWTAHFGVKIASVRAINYRVPMENACAEFMLGLHHVQRTWQDRIGLGVCVRFAWRIIAHEQHISMALLVAISGATEQTDLEQACEGIWQALNSALPVRDVLDYRPVVTDDELTWLRQPLQKVVSAHQISRREERFEFADKPIYMMRQLGMNEGSRHRLLSEMMRLEGLHVFDVQFTPTEWQHSERLAIGAMLHNRALPSMNNDDNDIAMMLQQMSDSRYMRALEHYRQMLSREILFEMHITLASDTHIDSAALPVLAGTNLFGTSYFEVRSAHLDEERERALHLLRDVDGKTWWRSSTPVGLERVPYMWQPEEALTAARLPLPDAQGIPGFRVLNRKITPLPLRLAPSGLVLGDAYDPKLSREVPIYLPLEERMRHAYVVGRTGTGKTTLLENMVVQDIHMGRGVGVIDPHGDLIEKILARIPPERAQDVILFDPSDMERPIGLNILDVEGEYEQNMVIAEFIGLLYSLYDPGHTGILGPRFEQMMRNGMLVAMANESTTLVDVMRIISDRDYLKKMLKAVTDPVVRTYWEEIANKLEYQRAEMLDYVTSKLNRFIGDIAIRGIIAQPGTTVDFAEVMNEGKILLVNLSKGKIGPEISQFLGLLMVPRLLITAFQRAHLPEEKRTPFFLYIDEFHNFTTPALATMLSEGRKYGLSLTLANQFISQLAPSIREAIFGNFGTMGVFQVGIRDAKLLEEEMYPVFDSDDLVNMPPYHVALKLPTGGTLSKPFSMQTRSSWDHTSSELAGAIRDYSRMTYGRDVAYNNAFIYRRFNEDK